MKLPIVCGPVQAGVLRPAHLAHSTGPDGLEGLEDAEASSGFESHGQPTISLPRSSRGGRSRKAISSYTVATVKGL
jgi:hypothetical protein